MGASLPPAVMFPATFVAQPSEAGIRAARASAVAAGGGTVLLPDAIIALTAPIPCDSGVRYVGVPPNLAFTGDVPDSNWTYTSGTVLTGDGTFPAFSANTTPAGSPVSPFAVNGIGDFSIEDVAFDTFTSAVQIGATNVIGLEFGRLNNLWISNCTDFGINLENFMHSDISRIWVRNFAHGMRFAASGNLLFPGNSRLHTLFCVNPASILSRGIVFEANNTFLNELITERLQVNRFGTSELSQTATFTSGSANIAVTDGTKFGVGLPIIFTTGVAGFTSNLAYFILSVSGNTITVGTGRTASAQSATASTSTTIKSFGMPNIELSSLNGGQVTNSSFLGMDMEGNASCSFYAENSGKIILTIGEVKSIGPYSHIVLRNAQAMQIQNNDVSLITDFDSPSGTTAQFYGARGTIRNFMGQGLWRDGTRNIGVLSLRTVGTLNRGDLEARGSNKFMYPSLMAMGQAVQTSDATTYAFPNPGIWIFAGSSACVATLPTITNAADSSTNIGAPYHVVNCGSANITLNTDGTQLFNKVAAKTSYTITPGQSIQVWGAKDASGNLFLAAMPSNGVS